jgi:hypothetical protein
MTGAGDIGGLPVAVGLGSGSGVWPPVAGGPGCGIDGPGSGVGGVADRAEGAGIRVGWTLPTAATAITVVAPMIATATIHATRLAFILPAYLGLSASKARPYRRAGPFPLLASCKGRAAT